MKLVTGNIAYNKPAEQMGTYDGLTADLAVDGDTTPDRGQRHCAYASSYSLGVWWKVDLGGLYTIDRVIVYNNNAYSGTSYIY